MRWPSSRARSSSPQRRKYWLMLSTVETPLAVAISTGSVVYPRASSRSGVGNVAENSSVWRYSLQASRIFFTSSMKPISSILSASSRMANSVQGNCRKRWFSRSRTRPGVPTTTWAPAWRARTCGPICSPPTIKVVLMPLAAPSSLSTSCTCSASSRVGDSTSPRTVERLGSIFDIIGAPKARVFPVPVSAFAITSLPCMTGSMARAWIGVGLVMPIPLIALWIFSARLNSSNDSMLGGSRVGVRGAMFLFVFGAASRPVLRRGVDPLLPERRERLWPPARRWSVIRSFSIGVPRRRVGSCFPWACFAPGCPASLCL